MKEQFPEIGMPDEQVLRDVNTINEAIDKLAVADRTKNRAKGSLGGMKSSRADDKLNALKDSNILLKEEITAWKSLRNASAHGSLHARPNELQKLLDNMYKAATLLNNLALLVIRYAGAYTDHSTRGWPEKEFPPQKEMPIPSLPDSTSEVQFDSPEASPVIQSDTAAEQEVAEQPAATRLVTATERAGTAMQSGVPKLLSGMYQPKDADPEK